MIWDYAQVPTQQQQLHLQLAALRAYGCQEVVQEKDSARKERPALRELLAQVQPGDTVVVWKLDRLGRSLQHLVELVLGFQERQIQFVSLPDHLDTTTAQGRLMFNLFASLAEFERDLIRERTQAGLAAARGRGRQGGRPPRLSKEARSKAEAVKTLYLQQDKTAAEIGQLLSIGRSTVYRYLRLLGVRGSSPCRYVTFPQHSASAIRRRVRRRILNRYPGFLWQWAAVYAKRLIN